MEYSELNSIIEENKDKLTLLERSLCLDADKREIERLAALTMESDFWEDPKEASKIQERIAHLERKNRRFVSLKGGLEDIEVLCELGSEVEDPDVAAEVEEALLAYNKNYEIMRLETLLSGEHDSANALVTLHAGAGGTEAQDWTQMLYRMYTRYCERSGLKVTVRDYLDGDEAGTKSVTFEVSGPNAYGYLRGEKGVHRLVRISPFDSNARRHTSFSSLDVAPVIEDESKLVIDMEDVRVDTYRSTGAGGQHVNKTDSAVRLTHMPSGIVVSCQNERSQVQNKETAMNMLRAKLIELREREKEEHMADIKGEMKKIEWGSQIRSYVFQPYTMVKDHRTGFESGNIDDVMDGNIDGFITAYLKML